MKRNCIYNTINLFFRNQGIISGTKHENLTKLSKELLYYSLDWNISCTDFKSYPYEKAFYLCGDSHEKYEVGKYVSRTPDDVIVREVQPHHEMLLPSFCLVAIPCPRIILSQVLPLWSSRLLFCRWNSISPYGRISRKFHLARPIFIHKRPYIFFLWISVDSRQRLILLNASYIAYQKLTR